jgi:hypothetical protein
LGIETLANIETKSLEARLWPCPFITGPAEVFYGGGERIGDSVNLLPIIITDITDPHFIGSRSERKSKGIAEPVAHDPAGVGVGTRGEGIIGEALARERIHPDEGAI